MRLKQQQSCGLRLAQADGTWRDLRREQWLSHQTARPRFLRTILFSNTKKEFLMLYTIFIFNLSFKYYILLQKRVLCFLFGRVLIPGLLLMSPHVGTKDTVLF
jgi:hypothetical protein